MGVLGVSFLILGVSLFVGVFIIPELVIPESNNVLFFLFEVPVAGVYEDSKLVYKSLRGDYSWLKLSLEEEFFLLDVQTE